MNAKNTITFSSEHVDDIEVLVLGELGLFSRAIAAKTGLSVCQVNYRLNKAGITRKGYRDGSSATVKNVIGLMAPQLRPEVQTTAQQKLQMDAATKAKMRQTMEKAAKKAAKKTTVSSKRR